MSKVDKKNFWPANMSKLDKKNFWKMNIKEIPVNINKLYTIEKITNHEIAGKGSKKVTGLLIKWEGDSELIWESLSGINATASGMVKEYLGRKNLKS